MTAVVGIYTDPATGSPCAVRFASAEDMYEFEEGHDVAFDSQVVLVDRRVALRELGSTRSLSNE